MGQGVRGPARGGPSPQDTPNICLPPPQPHQCLAASTLARGSPQLGSKGERGQQEPGLTLSSGPALGRMRSEGLPAQGKVPAAGSVSLAEPRYAGGKAGA